MTWGHSASTPIVINMKIAIFLCLLPVCFAVGPSAEVRGVFSHDGCGEDKCKQGEGDCDSDADCVDGLVCEFDNWWGRDYCVAGPKTKNGMPSDWTDWFDCTATACGTSGTQTRTRSCIAPEFGGHPCPKDLVYIENRNCDALCKPACNPATWQTFTWGCCTAESPCYTNEGDCDTDDQCAGDLVCRRKNCNGYKKRYPKPGQSQKYGKPACCGPK